MQKIVKTVALLILLSFLPSRALAWHGPSHLTVAQIAYEELQTTVSLLEMRSWQEWSLFPRSFLFVDGRRREFSAAPKRSNRYLRDIPQQQPPHANERGPAGLASSTRPQRS